MARWVTHQIEREILNATFDLRLVNRVHIHDQGGDVDSQNIVLEIKDSDDVIRIRGFDVDNDIDTPDCCECQFVELKAGEDSIGGLNSNEPNVALAYVKIRQMLQDRGFEVVPSLDPYF